MRTVLTSLLVFFSLFLIGTSIVEAGNSQLKDVDLDEDSTVLIKADLDQDDLYYYVDKTACNCFLRVADKHFSGLAPVDCWNLRKHEKLKEHVQACKPEAPKVELTTASVEAIAKAYRTIASAEPKAAAGKGDADDEKSSDEEDEE